MLDPEVASRVHDALFSQKYNLLLGAGASLDSLSQRNRQLQTSEQLREELCKLTGSRASSPLWRVAGLLTDRQIEELITRPFLGCNAGPTLKALTRFSWKTAFTLNIDDALEDAYESDSLRYQVAVPVNYTREYEVFRNPQELALIHLHGFARSPEDKYVFSLQEYAGVQKGLNAWVHALAGLIISEPFIIAGTTLFEPDLEYFFAHRPSIARLVSRAPSILIEPFPDAGTRRDCERLNLELVEAPLLEFLNWLQKEFGPPPKPLTLQQPSVGPRVIGASSIRSAAAFWVDFQSISAPNSESASQAEAPGGFRFGRPPALEDIYQNRDIPLRSQLEVMDELRRWMASGEPRNIICLNGRAGSGKSTTILRVAAEMVQHGAQVFYLRAKGGFDADSAAEFLSTVVDPILIVAESLAEHGDQLLDMLSLIGGEKRVCVVASERRYRMPIIRDILGELPWKDFKVANWQSEEKAELLRRYISLGLVGNAGAVKDPKGFAADLEDPTVAEWVCRILNDFRSLTVIVRSLWNDTVAEGRQAYMVASLAAYCHQPGVHKDILLSLYPTELLAELSAPDAPLQVSFSPGDSDYLIPTSPLLSALLIEEIGRRRPERLLEAAVRLADALAPFVTRRTIRQRTPETRLAGRLFDADGVTPTLLGPLMDQFYERTLSHWQWNSRYWEQRALHVSGRDRALAIQHARHAVAIERHPYPMTTLAKILFGAETADQAMRQSYFGEALSLMEETLNIERNWERGTTRTAFRALLDGVHAHLQSGGRMTLRQEEFVATVLAEVASKHLGSSDLLDRVERIRVLQAGDTEDGDESIAD